MMRLLSKIKIENSGLGRIGLELLPKWKRLSHQEYWSTGVLE